MSNPPCRQAVVTLDTTALLHNLANVTQLAPNSKVLAMVKANAYGHGVAHCLPALSQADGLGVASFAEAKEVRQLGWDKTIVLIEGVFSESEWLHALSLRLCCVVHHQSQLDWALKHRPTPMVNPDAASAISRPINQSALHPSQTIWLKLNTGMNRLGFEPNEIIAVAQALHDAGYQLVLTSHFANADIKAHPLNTQQIDTFQTVLTTLRQQVSPNIGGSLCNSAGIINFPECHFDWVRPGIMLYGSSPFSDISASEINLRPVMTFSTALMAIHDVTKGASIGYGSRYVADRSMRKGIISIGYGDGYPRVISDEAWVGVIQDNQCYRCPVIGRVAMDMITIDLSPVPSPSIASPVILWGNAAMLFNQLPLNDQALQINGPTSNTLAPSVDEVATWANTLGYELLCRLTQRPDRKVI